METYNAILWSLEKNLHFSNFYQRDGHEEELVKIVSLFMYLATVKYPNASLAATLQSSKLFSKEVQLRIKCILQVWIQTNVDLVNLK